MGFSFSLRPGNPHVPLVCHSTLQLGSNTGLEEVAAPMVAMDVRPFRHGRTDILSVFPARIERVSGLYFDLP